MPPVLAFFGIGTAAAATAGATAAIGTAGMTAGLSTGSLALMEAAGVAAGSTVAAGASWLPALSTITSIAGLGMSAVGQMQAGNQEADILEANADASRIEARSIQEAAKSETLRLSRERRKMIGSQAAIFGASGLDLSSGSPLDVMADTAASFEADIQQLGRNADNQAAAKSFEANIYDWAAPAKRRAGWIGAAGTALAGASQLGRAGRFGLPTYGYGV